MSLATERPPRPTPPKTLSSVPYLPGLDGLRAIAVLAVIFYHGDMSWMPGGFLGVEVFFVVSGYLITLLLIGEQERNARISLKGFWGRRARRLLPALYLLLASVALASSLLPYLRSSLVKLREEMLWAFLYATNWYQIFDKQSYFEAQGRPPLLRHLWSLAVEEQFYFVWPLIMILVFKAFGDRLPKIGLVLLSGSLLASIWMIVLYDPANPNRVYLGTDTRAGGLLLGAALAMLWRPYAVMRSPLRRKGLMIDLIGLGGLAFLVVTFVRWHDVIYTETGIQGYDLLYRGGFFLIGLATVAVILAATHLESRLGQRVLGARPLVWVGTRSYGLYLWHWPVFELLRPGPPSSGGDIDWPGPAVFALRLLITLTLTELSFRLVEVPIRTKRVKGWLRMIVRGSGSVPAQRRRRFATGVAVLLAASVFTGVSVATATESKSDIQQSLEAGQGAVTDIDQLIPKGDPPTTGTAGGTLENPPVASDPANPADPAGAPASDVPAVGETTEAPPTSQFIDRIAKFALGDSVMLGAAPKLEQEGIVVDAKVGRQAKEGVDILRVLNANHLLGDVLIIQLGTNGPTTKERLEELLDQAKDVPLVVLLTVKVPKPWEASVNAAIYAVVPEYPNVRLLDWNGWSQSSSAPEGIFYGDGIHLRPAGQEFYTKLIMDTIAQG